MQSGTSQEGHVKADENDEDFVRHCCSNTSRVLQGGAKKVLGFYKGRSRSVSERKKRDLDGDETCSTQQLLSLDLVEEI